MALLISAVLWLGALALVINAVIQQRLRQQRVVQRLQGETTRAAVQCGCGRWATANGQRPSPST